MATLFFDFDGTVADSEAGIVAALKYMVQDRGLRPLGIQPMFNLLARRWCKSFLKSGRNWMILKLSGQLMPFITIIKRKAYIKLNFILAF